MSDPSSGGTARLTPEEAFSVLGNELRLAILRTLREVDEATYSELKAGVGVIDSGRFNYHLSKLVGHFVARVEGGYRLRPPGEQVVRAIDAGMFAEDDDESYWPAEIGVNLETLDDATVYAGTRTDPTVHFRRAATLARECEEIRVLTDVVVSSAAEAIRTRSRSRTFVCVVTRDLFETLRRVPDLAEPVRSAVGTGSAAFYRYDGSVPYRVALADGTALVVQVDDEGTVQGHVETEDDRVRSWVASTIEVYRRASEPVTAEMLDA
jgi:DNA-binding transcriptional ArsR family regulator